MSLELIAEAIKQGRKGVLEALYPLVLEHGKPEYIRSDNGSEFIAALLQDWLIRVGINPIQIYPGSPWENGYNERFNGTLRHEVLNTEWFTTTQQSQIVIDTWLMQYNHIRPHQALGMRPPVPETINRTMKNVAQTQGPDRVPPMALCTAELSQRKRRTLTAIACLIGEQFEIVALILKAHPHPGNALELI